MAILIHTYISKAHAKILCLKLKLPIKSRSLIGCFTILKKNILLKDKHTFFQTLKKCYTEKWNIYIYVNFIIQVLPNMFLTLSPKKDF